MLDEIRNVFIVMVSGLLILFFIWGCQDKFLIQNEWKDERVVAKIDGYDIIVSDFASAVELAAASAKFSLEDERAKDQILEDLITRKVLIKEAQRRDIDKQKVFIAEIERYWEQALLKFLFRDRAQELRRSISIDDIEVMNEYKRRNKRVFADVLFFSEKETAQQLVAAGDAFDEVKQTLADKVVWQALSKWWMAGDLSVSLQGYLFSLGPGEISKVINYQDNWVIMKVVKIESVDMEPFEKVSSRIRGDLVKGKQETEITKWIEGLVEEAGVEVNYDVLKSIRLEGLCDVKGGK
jgi:hypothetical protein